MPDVDVLAVMGVCAGERRAWSERIAALQGRDVLPAARLALAPDPADEAAALVLWSGPGGRALVESPSGTSPRQLREALDQADGVQLSDLVCILDASHLLADLLEEDYLACRVAHHGRLGVEYIARSLMIVLQIESASALLLVNSSSLDQDELDLLTVLLRHLNPEAMLLSEDTAAEALLRRPDTVHAADVVPGWRLALEDGGPAVRGSDQAGRFCYSQPRPFHPGRLVALLDEGVEAGEFGLVLRSAGFCSLASRAGTIALWQQVGRMCSILPHSRGSGLDLLGDRGVVGQELVFIGIGMDIEGLGRALDAAVLDDGEFQAGPRAWAELPDPLPVWNTSGAGWA